MFNIVLWNNAILQKMNKIIIFILYHKNHIGRWNQHSLVFLLKLILYFIHIRISIAILKSQSYKRSDASHKRPMQRHVLETCSMVEKICRVIQLCRQMRAFNLQNKIYCFTRNDAFLTREIQFADLYDIYKSGAINGQFSIISDLIGICI